MRTQGVSERAVQDLLARIPWATCRVVEILETVHSVLPQLEAGDEAGAIRAAVQIETRRDGYQKKFWTLDCIKLQLCSCIRELDHYSDKRAVVKAALARLCDIRSKESRLYKMQQQLRDIFQNLDERTKAILEIRSELTRIDGSSNPCTDFANLLDDFDSVNVEVLRSELELALLLQAYDMARKFNQTML